MINNELYLDSVKAIANLGYDWNKLKNKTVLLAGARGLIGSFFIDLIMYLNKEEKLNCTILAIGRNKEKIEERFNDYNNNSNFKIYELDINNNFNLDLDVDYIIHGASNTHPVAYSTDPVGTITTNVIGLYNLLNLAVAKKVKKFIFLSSVEVYGENSNNVDSFTEIDFGYINCNTLRAGYPESKRLGEALCQAYIQQYDLDISIARISRVYGPTVLKGDSKAIFQFINKAVNNENIVLKSEGNQYFSYSYVGDVVSAIALLLFKGQNGEVYNVADSNSNILLRDLAKLIANYVGKEVVFELPNETERKGFSVATKAVIDGSKLESLGFVPLTPIDKGIKVTIDILKEI